MNYFLFILFQHTTSQISRANFASAEFALLAQSSILVGGSTALFILLATSTWARLVSADLF